jgi:hypothetical protein
MLFVASRGISMNVIEKSVRLTFHVQSSSLMRRLLRAVLAIAVIALIVPGDASAGMPFFPPTEIVRMFERERVLGLTQLTRERLEAISFFLLGLFAASTAIWRIWNVLRSDFPALPRLSFGKALGLVVLWGLLFVLVLTMISGARELMTPGAWQRKGFTYTLTPEPPSSPDPAEVRRRASIEQLRDRLVASKTRGRYPRRNEIPAKEWRVPGLPGESYVYIEGRTDSDDALDNLLACEPESAGCFRFILTTGGDIRLMPGRWIAREVEVATRRP